MTPETLRRRFPRLIPEGFCFACGDGWTGILEAFFGAVEHALPPETQTLRWADVSGRAWLPSGKTWVLKQVKEKFGTLRIYYDTGRVGEAARATIRQALDLAEARSHHTCEQCGRRGWMRDDHGWYFVACDRHARSKDDDSILPRDEAMRWFSVRVHREGGEDECKTYDPDTDTVFACTPPQRDRW